MKLELDPPMAYRVTKLIDLHTPIPTIATRTRLTENDVRDVEAWAKEARASRETLGYQVFTEDQNFFRLQGATATLAEKPDLIAVKGNDAVIVDAKTGKPIPHHAVQVLTYMYAVPRAIPEYKGMEFRGHIVYPGGNVQIPVVGLDQRFIDRLGTLIRWLADETPASKVPSASECGGATSPPPTARNGWRRGEQRKGGPRIFER